MAVEEAKKDHLGCEFHFEPHEVQMEDPAFEYLLERKLRTIRDAILFQRKRMINGAR